MPTRPCVPSATLTATGRRGGGRDVPSGPLVWEARRLAADRSPPPGAPPPATPDQILQFLTTEHFTLATARAATIAEANGRSSLFLATVSSAVVALAFVGQVTEMGEAFLWFSLVLFPSLFFLGFVTFERSIQVAIENMIVSRGINRIRHYYAEIAPQASRYLILSTHDDVPGVLKGMGVPSRPWEHFVTVAGTVSGINSILLGVFVGILTGFTPALPLWGRVALGAGSCAAALVGHGAYQRVCYREVEAGMETLFPTPEGEGGAGS